MARHWPDDQLDRVTPPMIKDARGRAALRILDRLIAERPVAEFYVRDAETCPAEALPALIAEYSMEEFIDPELPEHVQRRLLKHAWYLQSQAGTDAGVKHGLSLLGMNADITQWHQQEPKATPNTHRIDVMIDEVLWPDSEHFSLRQIRAMQRMIDATKRWSQESDLRIGVRSSGPAYIGAFPSTYVKATADYRIDPPPVTVTAASFAVIPFTRIQSTVTTA